MFQASLIAHTCTHTPPPTIATYQPHVVYNCHTVLHRHGEVRRYLLISPVSPLLVMCARWSLNCAEVRNSSGTDTEHDHCVFALSSSGAQGEYAGLAAIKAYLNSKGESGRNVSVGKGEQAHSYPSP